MRVLAAALLGTVLTAAAAGAEAGLPFRNTDASAVFLWWPSGVAEAVLRRPVAVFPGERSFLPLGTDGRGVGVFVPTVPRAGYLTPLNARTLSEADRPAKGTLLADARAWAGLPVGSGANAPLQSWGLVPPDFVLDGKTEGDADLPVLTEWGPGFLPGGQPWNRNRPKPRTLAASEAEGQLRLRLTADKDWSTFPAGVGCSLLLRSAGLVVEVPLTGTEGAVWVWGLVDQPTAAGRTVRAGAVSEAVLVWDRLPAGTRRAWEGLSWTWELAVTENDAVRPLSLGLFSFGDLE